MNSIYFSQLFNSNSPRDHVIKDNLKSVCWHIVHILRSKSTRFTKSFHFYFLKFRVESKPDE